MRAISARPILLVVLALAAALGSAEPAVAQATRLGSTFFVQPPDLTQPTMRYSDLAFDTQNNVYLAVWGMFPVKGRFLDASGTPLGTPFWVPETSRSLIPRVAYSPDANAFLVTCLDDTEILKIEGQSGQVLGRLVRYAAGGVPQFVTPEFVVSRNGLGKIPEKPPVVSYSTQSKEFLVAWTDKNGYVPGIEPAVFNTDIRARRVQLVFNPGTNDYGAQLAPEGEMVIAGRGEAEELPSIAYNPVLNQFMVAFMRETSVMSIVIQLVQAGSNSLLATNTIYTGARENYPEIAYIAATGQYQVVWWHAQAGPAPDSPDVWGRLVSADGVEQGAGATIIAGSPGFEGGPALGISYHPHAQTSLSVFQSPYEPELGAIEIGASGSPTQTLAIPVTAFITDLGLTTARLAVEPRVAANLNDATTKQWLSICGVDYAQIVGQRVTTGGGGTATLTPPPSALTATYAGGSQINLAWAPGAPDTSEYLVERSLNPTVGWAQIGTTTGTAYSDTAASCGTSYYYRVRGRRLSDGAYSAYSNTAGAATSACPPMPIVIDPTMPTPWFFAEGAASVGGLAFDTYYQVLNPHPETVRVRFYFSNSAGVTYRQTFDIPPSTKQVVQLSDPVYGAGVAGDFGAVAQSLTAGRQVYITRQVFWGDNWEGSTAEAGSRALSRTWYFAEGSRISEYFQNYFTVFNPTSGAGTVRASFYRTDGAVITVDRAIGPQTRITIDANAVLGLEDRDFSTTITSSVDIVAERVMYWGPNWMGGHASIGTTTASASWFFAEGASANNFDTYYTILNPNDAPVTLNVTYFGLAGPILTTQKTVAARARDTITLSQQVGLVTSVAAQMYTAGGEGVIIERSVYWGNNGFPNWVDGTNSLGSTATATAWLVPEGAITPGFDTYVLVANPGTSAITARLTLYSTSGQAPYSFDVVVPANGRNTVYLNYELALRGMASQFQSFSVLVTPSDGVSPLVVEEAMYWRQDGANYWRAGSAMLGIRQ